MRVTFIYRGRYLVRQALELETLVQIARHAGHGVEFLYDPDVFGRSDNVLQSPWLARQLASPERAIRRVEASNPDVAVFSVLPGSFKWARTVAAAVKRSRPASVIVFIGLHPTLAPERVMREDFVDFVIQGEAEDALNPLLEAIETGRGDYESVGNLWRRASGQEAATLTFRAPLVDLDALPPPDKELFRPSVSHRYSYAAMISRGCPFQCTFCEETCAKNQYRDTPGGAARYFRRKSVDTVMEELLAAKERYRFREVIFKDSYLSGDRAWLDRLMDRYRSEIGAPFKCFCTILGFDAATALSLKRGGCYSIEFGLQTWNRRVRRGTLGRAETNRQAFEAFGHCADAGIWYDVDHMFGLPGETTRDHAAGAAIYRSLRRLNRVKVHHLVYLPGAPIVGDAIAEGLLPPDARDRLDEGWESDFYDQGGGDESEAERERKRIVAGYAALYKLLPALPAGLSRWFWRRSRRARVLRWIPGPLMALLQGLLAFRGGDLRFAAYLRIYPLKVARAAADRWRK